MNYLRRLDNRQRDDVRPSLEADEEFKVNTSSFSAEYGASAGAVVNVVTKSGAIDHHGSSRLQLRSRTHRRGTARQGSWNLERHADCHDGLDRPAVKERRFVPPMQDGIRSCAYQSFVNDRVECGQADKTALFPNDTFQ